MSELLYHTRLMEWEPANTTAQSLVSNLKERHNVYAQLEPGDGTRYDLLLSWIDADDDLRAVFHLGREQTKDALLVTRVSGGEVVGTCLFGWMNYGAVVNISHGNEWTAKLLEWWLDELLQRLNA